MLKFSFLFAFFAITINSLCQVEFFVSELELSKIDISKNEEFLFDESYFDGPYLHFDCIVTNKAPQEQIFFPANSKLLLSFYYKGSEHLTEVFALKFQVIERLSIAPGETLTFSFGANVFLGTSILDENKTDYSQELIQVLPTLSLKYIDNFHTLQTCKIISTVIIE
jgi:hypothetical protein